MSLYNEGKKIIAIVVIYFILVYIFSVVLYTYPETFSRTDTELDTI